MPGFVMIASRVPPRALLLTGLLLVILGCTLALAQSPSEDDYSGNREELFAKYFDMCMKDWNVSTHMTKEEWARTCRRVVNDRIEFFLRRGGEVEPKKE